MSRRFLTPSKVPKYLICAICSEVYKNPVCLSCSHTFCRACIETWLVSNKTCPICRAPSNKKLISEDLIAGYAINDLEVICTNKGCAWTGRLEDSSTHDQACKFHPSRLEDWIATKIPIIQYKEDEDIEKPEESLLSSLYTNFTNIIRRAYEKEKIIVFPEFPFSLDSEEEKNTSD